MLIPMTRRSPAILGSCTQYRDKLYFIAYYSPKQTLSDIGTWFTKAMREKYKESPVYAR